MVNGCDYPSLCFARSELCAILKIVNKHQGGRMTKLREAELYDTRQITLLAMKYFDDLEYDNLYREIHKTIESDNGVVYVVARNDVLIAFAQCEIQGYNSATLKRVCVEKEYIRKQTGEKLVKKCGEWAQRNGCEELIYNCLQEQEVGVSAYSLLGFDAQKKIVL